MADRQFIVVHITVAWWLRWWIASVFLFAQITGMTPDEKKVARMARRAIRIKRQT